MVKQQENLLFAHGSHEIDTFVTVNSYIKAARNIGIFFVFLFAWFIWAIFGDTRRPNRYLIPDGYVGRVRIEYRVKGAPKLPLEDGHLLFRVSKSGRVQTSSVMQDGWASDDYYYVSKHGRHQIDNVTDMIWEQSFEPNGANEKFFVGTEQQYRKAEVPEGRIPDGPLDPKTLLPLKQKHN